MQREVLLHPDPRLALPATLVLSFDQELAQIASEMVSIARTAGGVGLAGTQLAHGLAIVVVVDRGTGAEADRWLTMVNPRIVDRSRQMDAADEGCLSLPGLVRRVKRHLDVVVEHQDVQGALQLAALRGTIARIAQHELDHLRGITLLERTGRLARGRR